MFATKLQSNEHIEHRYHQTLFVLVKPVFISLALLYIPWSFLARYSLFGEYEKVFFVWAIVIVLYIARTIIVWWLNMYMVTNQRLVRVTHAELFKKIVMETPLERILNVSFKTTGFWSSVLGYGDVEVQVVGLIEPMVLKNIKHPAQIKDYLWQLHNNIVGRGGLDIPHIQEKIGYTKENQKII